MSSLFRQPIETSLFEVTWRQRSRDHSLLYCHGTWPAPADTCIRVTTAGVYRGQFSAKRSDRLWMLMRPRQNLRARPAQGEADWRKSGRRAPAHLRHLGGRSVETKTCRLKERYWKEFSSRLEGVIGGQQHCVPVGHLLKKHFVSCQRSFFASSLLLIWPLRPGGP